MTSPSDKERISEHIWDIDRAIQRASAMAHPDLMVAKSVALLALVQHNNNAVECYNDGTVGDPNLEEPIFGTEDV